MTVGRAPGPAGMPQQERQGFAGIQALRAVAALAVAVLHVADEAGGLAGTPGRSPYPVLDALPLEAGVDLFFVISGFVMVWACWDSFGRAAAVAPFVWRRLLRIVPLYWLLSLATVMVALAAPGTLSDGLRDGWGYVAASFGFLPWRRMDGFVQPILRLGWTLEYEVLFYAVVACTLPLRRPAGLGMILGVLAALVLAGQAWHFSATPIAFWTDPILAEFALGVLAAIAARRGWRACWPALAAAAIAAAMASQAGEAPRALLRGVPAVLLLFSALSWRRIPKWLVLLGDASYALYLVHPFAMRAVRIVLTRLPGVGVPVFLAVTLPAAVLAAVLLHVLVEQPMLRFGRRRIVSPPAA